MSPQDANPLARLLSPETGRALLVHDGSAPSAVASLTGSHVVHEIGDGRAVPQSETPDRWPMVGAVLPDAASLRRLVSALPRLGKARTVAVWLVEAPAPALLTARPEWPPVTNVQARKMGSGGFLTVVRFARGVLANDVLAQLARDAVPGRPQSNGGLIVATLGTSPLAADPGVDVLPDLADAVQPDRVMPPDVVLADADAVLPEHDVIARPPLVLGPDSLPVGPIDERVLNPRGFVQRDTFGIPELGAPDSDVVEIRGDDVHLTFDARRGATAAAVQALRNCQAVRVAWPARESSTLALVVAGLAAAGVPLVGDPVPAAYGDRLGRRLVATLAEPVELDDPLRREEHSVRLRRAAFLEHSGPAWRGGLAVRAGVSSLLFPSCSVVLATRRPEQLDFALRQFSKQRHVDAELVLVTHGFAPDEASVRAGVGDRPCTVVPMPEETLFGDVLNAGLAAVEGDLVMKMDDDDWYGPDFLLDLVLARLHSGAEVVGTTSEYVYLDKLALTLRRTDQSERTAKFVAGGTLMLERPLLRELGGFRRARRFVDASLLRSVSAAGGSIYRGHGLGYVLRRTTSGHTWEPGLDFFLDPRRMGDQWDGFVPSLLLEHDAADRPDASGGTGPAG